MDPASCKTDTRGARPRVKSRELTGKGCIQMESRTREKPASQSSNPRQEAGRYKHPKVSGASMPPPDPWAGGSEMTLCRMENQRVEGWDQGSEGTGRTCWASIPCISTHFNVQRGPAFSPVRHKCPPRTCQGSSSLLHGHDQRVERKVSLPLAQPPPGHQAAPQPRSGCSGARDTSPRTSSGGWRRDLGLRKTCGVGDRTHLYWKIALLENENTRTQKTPR